MTGFDPERGTRNTGGHVQTTIDVFALGGRGKKYTNEDKTRGYVGAGS